MLLGKSSEHNYEAAYIPQTPLIQQPLTAFHPPSPAQPGQGELFCGFWFFVCSKCIMLIMAIILWIYVNIPRRHPQTDDGTAKVGITIRAKSQS